MTEIILNELEQRAREQLILPLDGLTSQKAYTDRIGELHDLVGMFKVGMGSHTRFGNDIVSVLRHVYHVEMFLDLKFKDIPETVKDAAMAAGEHGVYMFNVHASGLKKMMQYAMEGAQIGAAGGRVPKVLGVTLLTSISDEEIQNELLPEKVLQATRSDPVVTEDLVKKWAENARDAGLDGIVCSAADVAQLKASVGFPEGFLFVTPGIKAPDGKVGKDQVRVDTPYGGLRGGATHLVVGRAITDRPNREDRRQAAYSVLQDMARFYQ